MVILDLTRQAKRTIGAQRFNSHNSHLALESLFQKLSIWIMSWDSEVADKPLTKRERYVCNAIEPAAAQVPSEAFHCVNRLVAEQ